MFIRPYFRTIKGTRRAYWALVESYRSQRGPRQRVVAWLGQLDEAGRLGVKQAAEEAGRDPAKVRVWSCFATVGDHLPADVRLRKTVGRMATYLQAYGDLMVRTNSWDPEVLRRFREDDLVKGFRSALDATATTEQLEHVATLIPEDWLASAAMGSAEQCVEKIRGQLDIGCDGVILHGASPAELAPIVEEYRKQRPAGRFDHLAANPAG